MPFSPLQKIIIIGAGISGATAASEFAKLGIPKENILILEKNRRIGGKLKTYHHPDYPELVTEYGAGALTHNYSIIEELKVHNIHVEFPLPADKHTLAFQEMHDKLSGLDKIKFYWQFGKEMLRFGQEVKTYNRARADLDDKPPKNQDLPFHKFAKKYQLTHIETFLEWLVPLFGYDDMRKTTTDTARILDYMKYTTIPALATGGNLIPPTLLGVRGGYETLPQKMLEDFQVETKVNIKNIDRQNNSVTVQYEKGGELKTAIGNILVLTPSPMHWPKLGMKLTAAEQQCVDNLTYNRYPIAICELKGAPALQYFNRKAAKREGFNHVAFLYTRDNRLNPEEGRLCTAYINIPPGKNEFSLAEGSPFRESILNDLRNIPGVREAKIVSSHIWKDYNASVPWKEATALRKEELLLTSNTIHLGSYACNDTVNGVASYAKNLIARKYGTENSLLSSFMNGIKRSIQFFKLPCDPPISEVTKQEVNNKTKSRP